MKLARGSYVNMSVIPIPSPGLGRLRVGGLASQLATAEAGSWDVLATAAANWELGFISYCRLRFEGAGIY
jgi:hypothetical protein